MPIHRIAFAVAILVFAACTSGSGSSTPTPTEAPASESPEATQTTDPSPTPDTSFEYSDCLFEEPVRVDVMCGFLTVPERRSDPASRDIELHVAVFKATGDDPASDPVIYLEGGPGGDTLDYVWSTFDLYFDHLLEDRDVILYDQRGVGLSTPTLWCWELEEASYADFDSEFTDEEWDERFDQATRDCHSRLLSEGFDLSAYNTMESAADLDDLREALGYEQWNLYGISYGSKLALTTIREYPASVRSAVLDSPYPLEADLFGEGPANTVQSLEMLFGACRGDVVCRTSYPDLEESFITALRRLDANPISVEFTDPFTFAKYEERISGQALFQAVAEALYDGTVYALLPLAISEVSNHNYDLLSGLVQYTLAQTPLYEGAYLSVQCYEEMPFTSLDVVQESAAQFPDYAEYLSDGYSELFDTCKYWALERAPERENQPVVSEVPALILSGEWDPVTPPQWGEDVSEHLSNSRFYVFDGVGHGVSIANDCAKEMMQEFLSSPGPSLIRRCLLQQGQPFFLTPY